MSEKKQSLDPEIQRLALQFFQRLIAGNVCTVCGEPIERKQKIGHCIYGWPCGHRMYQGGLGGPVKERIGE